MKYLDVLTEKNLVVTDLSVGLQKKIAALNKTAAKLDEDFSNMEEGSQERLDVSAEIEKLSFVDAELSSKIQKFDKEAYANKLEVINTMNEKKRAAKAPDTVKLVNEPVKEKAIPKEEPKPKEDVKPKPTKNESGKAAISELKKTAEKLKHLQQQAETLVTPAVVAPVVAAPVVPVLATTPEEVFHKAGDANPSKRNWALAIFGVGAFILTFGAYQAFKNQR